MPFFDDFSNALESCPANSVKLNVTDIAISAAISVDQKARVFP